MYIIFFIFVFLKFERDMKIYKSIRFHICIHVYNLYIFLIWSDQGKNDILLINRVYIQTWKDLIIYVANYKRGTCAEEVCNFIALHGIIKKLYCLTFRAIYSTNAKPSDAHMQKGSIKNCSIKLYNKVKIIQLLYMH